MLEKNTRPLQEGRVIQNRVIKNPRQTVDLFSAGERASKYRDQED